nr:unnamed protein product [Naegleria fowleri]
MGNKAFARNNKSCCCEEKAKPPSDSCSEEPSASDPYDHHPPIRVNEELITPYPLFQDRVFQIRELFHIIVMNGLLPFSDLLQCERVCKLWYQYMNGDSSDHDDCGMWGDFIHAITKKKGSSSQQHEKITKVHVLMIQHLLHRMEHRLDYSYLKKFLDIKVDEHTMSSKSENPNWTPQQYAADTNLNHYSDMWNCLCHVLIFSKKINSTSDKFQLQRFCYTQKYFFQYRYYIDSIMLFHNLENPEKPLLCFCEGQQVPQQPVDNTSNITNPTDYTNCYIYNAICLKQFTEKVRQQGENVHTLFDAFRYFKFQIASEDSSNSEKEENIIEESPQIFQQKANNVLCNWLAFMRILMKQEQGLDYVYFEVMRIMFHLCRGHFNDTFSFKCHRDISQFTSTGNSEAMQYVKTKYNIWYHDEYMGRNFNSSVHQSEFDHFTCFAEQSYSCTGSIGGRNVYWYALVLSIQKDGTGFQFAVKGLAWFKKRGRCLS